MYMYIPFQSDHLLDCFQLSGSQLALIQICTVGRNITASLPNSSHILFIIKKHMHTYTHIFNHMCINKNIQYALTIDRVT